MECPNCHTGCAATDMYCRHCGTDLEAASNVTRDTNGEVSSTGLVPTQSVLPAVLHNPQLPRLAAGVGALAFGVGIELLRRGLLTRLTRIPRSSSKWLPAPTIGDVRDLLTMQDGKAGRASKPPKLPRGYEIHETVVYMSRVIRRED